MAHLSRPRPRSLLRDADGAVMIEFTLVVVLLLGVTFAIVDFARMAWIHTLAAKGAERAARLAVQSDPAASGFTAYSAVGALGLAPGTDLTTARLPAFTLRCTAAGCTCTVGTCAVGTGYDADAFAAIAAAAQLGGSFPVPAEQVYVEYAHIGQGFAGRPGPDVVPMVSVGMTGLQHDWIIMQAFGFDTFTMSDFRTTLPAEDLATGGPT